MGAAVTEGKGIGTNGLSGTKSCAAADRRNTLWCGEPAVTEAEGIGMNGLSGTKSRAAGHRRNALWRGAPGVKLAATADSECGGAAASMPLAGSIASGGVCADASLP